MRNPHDIMADLLRFVGTDMDLDNLAHREDVKREARAYVREQREHEQAWARLTKMAEEAMNDDRRKAHGDEFAKRYPYADERMRMG